MVTGVRPRIPLDGFWGFRLDPGNAGESNGWFKGFESSDHIYVPASWNEQNPDWDGYSGVAWYLMDFYVPRELNGLTPWIIFEGSGYLSRVWVNGVFIGEHEGSFTLFKFKIPNLNYGGWNRVVVKIDNTLKPDNIPPGEGLNATYFDFYHYGGIQRPVWVEFTHGCFIDDLIIATRHDGYLKVQPVVNCSRPFKLELSLLDKSGGVVYSRVVEGAFEDYVKGLEPWSIEHPVLYTLEARLITNNDVEDTVTERIGFRTFEVKAGGFYLNGESIFLKGFGRHEDYPIFGRALPGPVLIRDYYNMRRINANSFRTSHYPYSNAHLDLADEFGVLVILEAPLVGLREHHFSNRDYLEKAKRVISEMIRQHRNRPSVVMYSVANEPNSITDEARVFLGELMNHVKSIDPTRPVIYTSFRHLDDKALGLGDAVALNIYFGWYSDTGDVETGVAKAVKLIEEVHSRYPDKPIIITEFGAEGVTGLHHDPPVAWSEEYQELFLRRYIEELSKKPYVRGLHIWNYADFRTPQNPRRVILNTKGLYTRDRRPKLATRTVAELFSKLK
ncbi:glycoside hydrolase family 2 TIM barrel-domain containing protein [Caldivirga maquilingensis]|uniref:Beta-glucuronidase n=1 Tax=Caldivirga maquilingensis (strain ATCC 700844 / DSM 13496 / JCM 10307 / IC-167) TaxID=397948 RepID=A8M8Z3_CALMQ|nr:glycoside hydrolase family 2 TIM barrel-domain containing protein [Caldivirga maquilingensis]ABW02212.1 Beta-glucuronidase [Caldivirga maquilingensis IC-167]